MVKILKPTLKDIKKMQELVSDDVEKGIILYRSDSELATNIRSYTVAIIEDEIVGFSALHIHSDSLAEVRSLIVNENFQKKGIGSQIVKAHIEEAKKLKIEKLFTLTYRKSFFEKLEFKEIPKEDLPEQKIWADCIRCKHFPICDEIALIKKI